MDDPATGEFLPMIMHFLNSGGLVISQAGIVDVVDDAFQTTVNSRKGWFEK